MQLSGRVNILDTETTGFSPEKFGDRIVEIGIVEMIDGKITGREFHEFINPQSKLVGKSYDIHGLSDEYLLNMPTFKEIYGSFSDFIGNDPLVIHNAHFDMRFLDAEVHWIGGEVLTNKVIDTLQIAKNCNHGGINNSLSSLCKTFNVNYVDSELHSALTDARLLADIYIKLMKMK